jgi:hypothetical protein
MNELIENMIEVNLVGDSFLKVKETLERMGIASKKDNVLYQSCHILHKQSRYYIVHFKELFALDGKSTNFDESDIARRNTIANLLADWELVELVKPNKSADLVAPISQIKILAYKEKDEWTRVAKYNIGKKRD